MSKMYSIQESTLSGMADEIRVLHGTQDEMSTGEMIAELERANNAKDEQAELIATIKSTLAEKAMGVTLPELDNPGYASDLAQGKQFIDADGNVVEGNVPILSGFGGYTTPSEVDYDYALTLIHTFPEDTFVKAGYSVAPTLSGNELGDATPEDVRAGKTFTAFKGLKMTGIALLPGGGSVYPEGAFAPATQFTDGKQYALVAMIGGVRRYINTTDYNQYTMNATEITIAEDAGDYVIFSATPALFTAVASSDGFLLQNGSNYLHGTSSGGTALRVGTTQMVWTVDNSETGGFSSGKYNPKEDVNAVWLKNTSGGYDWSIKYETAGSFGYDREGRDGTYSTGFVSFVLYEYVAGEGEINPVVDTSDATATAGAILNGETAYVNGRKVTGSLVAQTYYYGADEPAASLGVDGDLYFLMGG